MINLNINKSRFQSAYQYLKDTNGVFVVAFLSLLLAVAATVWSYQNGYIISYGDAESHLNIAKRVMHSLTPGFAQLGGIWLPLPHLFMVPFVYFDKLWRTGLAGSIVSGISYIISAVYLYKLTAIFTKKQWAAFVAALVFMLNPNILYLQTTPMTELPLIAFFILSSYYFIKFILSENNFNFLILAALFGFCATLSRYDGWFLVLMEAAVLGLMYWPIRRFPTQFGEIKKVWNRQNWWKMQGHVIMFGTLAFFGILVWLAWDFLILGDPLYFTHSQFSAKSQQQNWLLRGELPGYKNILQSLLYYLVTAMSNSGVVIFAMTLIGVVVYLFDKKLKHRWLVFAILIVPFIFNVVTLFLGQSVIFIPHITPETFEWNLFNVRYGVMMVPLAAFIVGYLFYVAKPAGKALIAMALLFQLGLYGIGYSKVISFEDGVKGLSSASAKVPDAQYWIRDNYDTGLVLVDDFARTLSIVRTTIPMQNVIYVGNKPYWEESLKEPEKYATWIIMQKDDAVWDSMLENPVVEGRLYTYFQKVYTSPEILVFKRNDAVVIHE
jgi:hypothetical protein